MLVDAICKNCDEPIWRVAGGGYFHGEYGKGKKFCKDPWFEAEPKPWGIFWEEFKAALYG